MSRFVVSLDSFRSYLFKRPSYCPNNHPLHWHRVGVDAYSPICLTCGPGEEVVLSQEHIGRDFTLPFARPDVCPHDGFPVEYEPLYISPMMLNPQRGMLDCLYCRRSRPVY